MNGQKIADNYGQIATQLKQIEADKVQMLKGKPAEEISISDAVAREHEAKFHRAMDVTWMTAIYTSGDFDPA